MDVFPVSHDLLGKSASAYEHLRRALTHGQLRPGRRLSASNLAATFRISETPVREALVRLSAEGFLDWEASKGHFTRPVTFKELWDLHDMLDILLTACLSGAPRGASPRLEAIALRGLLAPGADVATASPEAVAEALGALGGALADRSGNAVLRGLVPIVLDRTFLIRRLDLDTAERIARAQRRGSALLAAVVSEELSTARAIMAEHLAERRGRLEELVAAAELIVAQANYP